MKICLISKHDKLADIKSEIQCYLNILNISRQFATYLPVVIPFLRNESGDNNIVWKIKLNK